MKTLIIAFITLFIISSCSKEKFYPSGGLYWTGYTLIPDSNNKVKADISSIGLTINHFSVSGAFFTRYVWPTGDSSIVTIEASNDSTSIRIVLNDILTPGLYSFGHISGQHKGIKATYTISGNQYNSNYEALSGSLIIDSLTTKRIKGSFSVTCWNGTQAADVTNGSFVGNVW